MNILRGGIRICVNRLFRILSYLTPRTDTLWIFIGWRFSKEREIFSESPKYLFLYVAEHHPELRPIWIGADKKICALLATHGYEAYPIHSLRGVYYSLRAGYTFVGAFMRPHNWRLCGGSKVVQLWHGKSLKKTGVQSPYSLGRRNRWLNPQLYQHFYKFIAISPFLGKFTTEDFCVPKETLLVSGTPKYDAMIASPRDASIDIDTDLEMLLKHLMDTGLKRKILYGPTFRPDGSNPLEVIDLSVLNAKLQETGDALVISLHPKFSTRDWIPEKPFSNIFFSQGEYDKYPLLNQFDLLISDYSSLSIDFMFLGKPVILFAYDFDKYQKEMGIYDELWNLMPGPKVFTFTDLLNTLDSNLHPYAQKIPAAQKKLFGHYIDSNASKRIVDALISR